jgi:hypothetical protein
MRCSTFCCRDERRYAMSLVGSGIVGPGYPKYFDVVLFAGGTYQVYVQPVDPSVDFDLYIYDENGVLVAQDTTTNSDAICNITVFRTGTFRLTVQSARGLSAFNILVQN